MPLYDYECAACGEVFEAVLPSGTETAECTCGGIGTRIFRSAPTRLVKIIPDYPGCKKHRAGYVHTHGDRPATKTQVQGASFK